MKSRCKADPELEYEPTWADFPVYLADILAGIGPPPARGLTVDRIDSERGYAPGNIRWATPNMQGSNKKASVHLWMRSKRYYSRVTKSGTAPEWCRYFSRLTGKAWTPENLKYILRFLTLEEIMEGVIPAWLVPDDLAQHEMDAALAEHSA